MAGARLAEAFLAAVVLAAVRLAGASLDAVSLGADRFAGLDWEFRRGGVPLLADALASLECEIVAEHPAGDHWIVVGRVEKIRVSASKDPLVFFAGAFGAVQSESD